MTKRKIVVARLGSVKVETRGVSPIGADELDSSPLFRPVG